MMFGRLRQFLRLHSTPSMGRAWCAALAASFVLLPGLTACNPDGSNSAQIQGENGFKVTRVPSEVFPRDIVPAWVDDDTVIFAAYSRRWSRNQDSSNSADNFYTPYIWKMSQGVSPYLVTDHSIRSMCSTNGFVTIRDGFDNKPGKRNLQGPFGEERPFLIPEREENLTWNEDTCRYRHYPEQRKTRDIRLLLSGDGYIDFGPRDISRGIGQHRMPNADLVKEDGSVVPLPVGYGTSFDSYCGSYSDYRQAYFFYRCNLGLDNAKGGSAPPGICRDFFWLWPDGWVETGCIPYGPWADYVIDVLPTRAGMVVANSQGEPDPNSGLYLIEDGRGIRIVEGWIQTDGAKAVSPDGCRIAALYSHDVMSSIADHGGLHTYVVADVCNRS